MPTYPYECQKCKAVTEADRRMADRYQTPPCVQCGAPTKLVIGRTSFVLKGTGWYKTDYQDK